MSKEKREPNAEKAFHKYVQELEATMAEVIASLELQPNLRLSSLDISVYAHLRTLLVNTPHSEQSKYLLNKCLCLSKFFFLMELLFGLGMGD